MKSSIGDKLKQIIESMRLPASRFAREIDISPQLLHSYLKNDTTPSVRVMKLIAVRYPELNTSWLLTGEGEMLKPKQETFFPEMETPKEQETGINIVDRLLNIIEKQQDELGEIKYTLKEIEAYLYKKNNQE